MNKLKLLVISAFAIALVAGSTLGLAIVFNGNGTFQTSEVLSIGTVDLDITLDPNETVQVSVPVTNNGAAPVTAILTADVVGDSPPGPYAGVTVTPSQTVNLQPGQTASVVFTITATNGIQPGTGTVALSVIRP